MRRFLYYIPGQTGCNETMLRRLGLWSRFSRPAIEYQVMMTPDGPAGGGVIVAPGPDDPRYAPNEQRWIPACIPTSPDLPPPEGWIAPYWVGIEKLNPCPEDLVREVGIGGYDLALDDGCVWRVPLIRRWDREQMAHCSNLPRSLMPKNGRFVQEIRPEYQEADGLAEKIFASFVAGRTVGIDEWYPDAAGLLAVNYRLGMEEVGLLGLFAEPSTGLRVTGLSIDVDAITAQASEVAVAGLEAHQPRIED